MTNQNNCDIVERKLRHQKYLDWAYYFLECIIVGVDLGIKIYQQYTNNRRNDWEYKIRLKRIY